jgi:hypothetical protein
LCLDGENKITLRLFWQSFEFIFSYFTLNHSILQDLFECSLYPILEKQLEPSEIHDLIDDIYSKLRGRSDKNARSIIRLMRGFEETLRSTNRLPVNAVNTIMRTSAGLNGKWGKASSGSSGKGDGSIPPFPPSPTRHAQKWKKICPWNQYMHPLKKD